MKDLALDHILFVVQDIDKWNDDFFTLTGVQPIIGGIHPSYGTINSLVSIGNNQYLEFISYENDKNHEGGILGPYPILKTFFLGWCVRSSKLESSVDLLRHQEFEFTPIMSGCRITPEMNEVSWTYTFSHKYSGLRSFPFLIEWRSSHPSAGLDKGLGLESFTIKTLESEVVQKIVTKIDFPISIIKHDSFNMELVLNSENGKRFILKDNGIFLLDVKN